MNDNVKEIIETFFDKLSIHIESINITQEDKNIFTIKIKSKDS
jgi:hypothetical protein